MINCNADLNEICELCEKTFSHSQLIEFLSSGDIPKRQIAALKLDKIESKNEAEILLSNLVGVDGKIREAVSLKLNEILKEDITFFVDYSSIFVEAVIDVNGNVCRQIMDCLKILSDSEKFVIGFKKDLLKKFKNVFEEFDKLTFKDRKYTVNKIMFKFYWCLEAVFVLLDDFEECEIENILVSCSKMEDYTVREKVAKILAQKCDSECLLSVKNALKNDENYYVKRY